MGDGGGTGEERRGPRPQSTGVFAGQRKEIDSVLSQQNWQERAVQMGREKHISRSNQKSGGFNCQRDYNCFGSTCSWLCTGWHFMFSQFLFFLQKIAAFRNKTKL